MSSLETFSLFPQLPFELRQLIWRMAMPPFRLVTLDETFLKIEDSESSGDLTCESFARIYWDDEFEELQYLEDRYGRVADYEIANLEREADMNMFIHTPALGSRRKEQKQLKRYGFTSSRPTPTIYSSIQCSVRQEFDEHNLLYTPACRNVRINLHLHNELWDRTAIFQRQLKDYGFTSSQPTPKIIFVTSRQMGFETRRSRIISWTRVSPLLFTCNESRALMKLSGYEHTFSSRCAPAGVWFNFHQDWLYLHRKGKFMEDNFWERRPWNLEQLSLKDRARIRRIAISSEEEWDASYFWIFQRAAKLLGHLDEIVFVMMDSKGFFEKRDDEWMFLNCHETDLSTLHLCSTSYPVTDFFYHEFKDYESKEQQLPFFDWMAQHLQEQLLDLHRNRKLGKTDGRNRVDSVDIMYPDTLDWTIPKIRFVRLLHPKEEETYQKTRMEFWKSRVKGNNRLLTQRRALEERIEHRQGDTYGTQWVNEMRSSDTL